MNGRFRFTHVFKGEAYYSEGLDTLKVPACAFGKGGVPPMWLSVVTVEEPVLHPPEYFHVMANIGGTVVGVGTPQNTMEEALQVIWGLRKEKVDFSVTTTRAGYDAKTTAVGFAEKVKRKRRGTECKK